MPVVRIWPWSNEFEAELYRQLHIVLVNSTFGKNPNEGCFLVKLTGSS